MIKMAARYRGHSVNIRSPQFEFAGQLQLEMVIQNSELNMLAVNLIPSGILGLFDKDHLQ